jgi:SSS family solute:Na+ symporter
MLESFRGRWDFIQKNLLGLSLLVNLPVLYEAPIIAQYVYENRLSGLWIFWAASIGFAFGLVFIAPLWKQIPTEIENGFHLFRYSGRWANVLYKFRAVFLGLIIIPLIATLNLHSFAMLFGMGAGLSKQVVILLLGIILFFTTGLNTMSRRFSADALTGILSFAVLLGIGAYWIFVQDNYSTGNQSIAQQDLFPNSAIHGLMIFGLHWILTGIYDFPDMEGQKLLYAREKGNLRQFLLLIFFLLVSQVFIYLLGIKAASSVQSAQVEPKGEEILGYFIQVQPLVLRTIMLGFLFFSFLSVIKNLQLWSGQLLSGLGLLSRFKYQNLAGMLMFMLAVLFWSLNTDGLLAIAKYLLVITSGVGPVFLLRWYWNRITAAVQLTAMISSLIIGNAYELAQARWIAFQKVTAQLADFLQLGPYLCEVLVCGIITCTAWLLVAFWTNAENGVVWKQFNETVRATERLKNPRLWLVFILIAALLMLGRVLAWNIGAGAIILSIRLFIALIVLATFVFSIAAKDNVK